MDSQYIVLSELLSDQVAFITSPKTSLENYWGGIAPPCPPVSTGLEIVELGIISSLISVKINSADHMSFFHIFSSSNNRGGAIINFGEKSHPRQTYKKLDGFHQ